MVSETIFYKSELGNLKIAATDIHITEIAFMQEDVAIEDLHKTPLLPVTQECLGQLKKYFAGSLQIFSFSMQQNGTLFQQRVWQELERIPFGKTISYHQLSKKLGNTKAIRAAASANGKNSLAIVVPCHRVIGSNGALIGYAGELWRKQWLLNHEAKHAHGVQSLF